MGNFNIPQDLFSIAANQIAAYTIYFLRTLRLFL
jgi:hypothetical protein